MTLRLVHVAMVCHEVNRAYCLARGDTSQQPWDDAPAWQQESAVAGVLAIAKGEITSARDSHTGWLKRKAEEGWRWGPSKNVEQKEHPCMMPFEELPPEQQMKDHLFVATARAVLAAAAHAREAVVEIDEQGTPSEPIPGPIREG